MAGLVEGAVGVAAAAEARRAQRSARAVRGRTRGASALLEEAGGVDARRVGGGGRGCGRRGQWCCSRGVAPVDVVVGQRVVFATVAFVGGQDCLPLGHVDGDAREEW